MSNDRKPRALKDKWALVTGSSRGVGRQIAKGLAEWGCNVLIHGREAANTEQTRELLAGFDVQIHVVAGELDSDAGIDQVIEGVQAGPGRVDILYNNAGVMSQAAPICEIPKEEWLRVLQVNLFALVRLCSAFAPAMAERGWGRIVNLTSGIADQPHLTPYSVSKAAVDKYSQDLAYAFREKNVLVNTLDPGWLKTDLGGQNAWSEVETVLPGALVPALLEDNGPTGRFFAAQDFKYLD